MEISSRIAFLYAIFYYITYFIITILRFVYAPYKLIKYVLATIIYFFNLLCENFGEPPEILIGSIVFNEDLQRIPHEMRVQLAMEHLLGDQFMPLGPALENNGFHRARRPARHENPNMPRVFYPDFEAQFFGRPVPIPRYPHRNRRFPNFRLAGDPLRNVPVNFPRHVNFGIGANPFPFVVLPPGVQDIVPINPVLREPNNLELEPAEVNDQQIEILRGVLPLGLPDRNLLQQRRRENPGE